MLEITFTGFHKEEKYNAAFVEKDLANSFSFVICLKTRSLRFWDMNFSHTEVFISFDERGEEKRGLKIDQLIFPQMDSPQLDNNL